MADVFCTVMIPVTDVGIVDGLAKEAVSNLLPELAEYAASHTFKVTGLQRNSGHYRFTISIDGELISDVLSLDVPKASFDDKTLAILEAMPYLSI